MLENSRLTVDYFKNHSDDVASSFPLLTPAIEAAFPGRVTRDPSGRLVSIDQRPVTFAETNSERLQIGLNLSGPLGKPRPESADTAGFAPDGPRGGQGGGQRGEGRGAGFNPERFAALREQLCTDAAADSLPTEEQIAALPEQLAARLKNDDGTINPERWKTFRERICNAPPRRGRGRGRLPVPRPSAGRPPWGRRSARRWWRRRRFPRIRPDGRRLRRTAAATARALVPRREPHDRTVEHRADRRRTRRTRLARRGCARQCAAAPPAPRSARGRSTAVSAST